MLEPEPLNAAKHKNQGMEENQDYSYHIDVES